MPNDLLKAIESIKKDMATKQDIQRVERGQAQTNNSLTHLTTAVEALAAGQKEQATKGDIDRLEQKIERVAKDVKSNEGRIENLEEATNTHNPHKN
jgi:predicted  nucleic acid-binding Zn-ribbon protein